MYIFTEIILKQLQLSSQEIAGLYHTIYKNDFVLCRWAVCGCMRVCDTSLEPPRPPYERLMGRVCFACSARKCVF